ncbi:hypothetical protein K431DRAFT_346433 [Polychaeton citri CBS 116435]|uniref:Uncharacterized protein n=1 Tax=Polychaeton citri CBS 116435 TaxID=1314669 RepID=A0A9P4UP33_9PEZI|nr:hypothetical protein K431DRAFT_346433 [Polychaeton citri CBS 116435]
MPRYTGLDVTAKLVVSPLDQSVSNNIVLRQGSETQTDLRRIDSALSSGHQLPERSLGDALEYVGQADEFHFCVPCIAGEGFDRHLVSLLDQTRPKSTLSRATILSADGDTPLKSLDDTPEQRHQHFEPKPRQLCSSAALPSTSHGEKHERDGKAVEDSPTKQLFCSSHSESVGNSTYSPPMALDVIVSISTKTFLGGPQSQCGPQRRGKNLKMEVFLDGTFMDVAFVGSRYNKPREGLVSEGSDVHHFHGSALRAEAKTRGTNMSGRPPPSAVYLHALSLLGIPKDAVAQRDRFGIIDVVITAGTGKKYGPEDGYLTRPTRMDNPHRVGIGSKGVVDTTVGGTASHIASSFELQKHSTVEATNKAQANGSIVINDGSTTRVEQLHGHNSEQSLMPIQSISKTEGRSTYSCGPAALDATTQLNPAHQDTQQKKQKLGGTIGDFPPPHEGAVIPYPQTSAMLKTTVCAGIETSSAQDGNVILVGRQSCPDWPLLEHDTTPSRNLSAYRTRAAALARQSTLTPIKAIPHYLEAPSKLIALDAHSIGASNNPTQAYNTAYKVSGGQPSAISARLNGNPDPEHDGGFHSGQSEIQKSINLEHTEKCVIGLAPSHLQRQAAKARNGQFEEEQLVCGMRFLVV